MINSQLLTIFFEKWLVSEQECKTREALESLRKNGGQKTCFKKFLCFFSLIKFMFLLPTLTSES